MGGSDRVVGSGPTKHRTGWLRFGRRKMFGGLGDRSRDGAVRRKLKRPVIILREMLRETGMRGGR